VIVHGHLNYLFEIFIVLVGYVSSTQYEKGGGRGGRMPSFQGNQKGDK